MSENGIDETTRTNIQHLKWKSQLLYIVLAMTLGFVSAAVTWLLARSILLQNSDLLRALNPELLPVTEEYMVPVLTGSRSWMIVEIIYSASLTIGGLLILRPYIMNRFGRYVITGAGLGLISAAALAVSFITFHLLLQILHGTIITILSESLAEQIMALDVVAVQVIMVASLWLLLAIIFSAIFFLAALLARVLMRLFNADLIFRPET